MPTLNKYRAVTGTLPRKYEIAKWNEEQYLQFFYIVQRFTDDGALKIKPEILLSLEQEATLGTTSFLTELFWRINMWSTDPSATPRKFYYKLAGIIRQVGLYLKEHPAQITEKMRTIIEGNPRLIWMTKHFKETITKVGVPVIVPNTFDTTLKERTGYTPTPENPQVKIMESMTTMADILHTLTSSLTKKELRELKTMDKVSAITKVATVLANSSKFKVNIGVLNNIKVNAASRDELEKAIQDFSSDAT